MGGSRSTNDPALLTAALAGGVAICSDCLAKNTGSAAPGTPSLTDSGAS
jgi:hypothetical protein